MEYLSHILKRQWLKFFVFFKVFTLCSDADSECPLVFNGLTTHVGFQDPPTLTKSLKDEDEQLKIYREVRDQIKKFILNIEEYI